MLIKQTYDIKGKWEIAKKKKNGGKEDTNLYRKLFACFPSLCHLCWGSLAARLFIPCHVQANLGTASTLTLAQGELDLLRSIQYFQLISLFI